jgi:nucleoside-diphosphate-sugar epimerase
MRVLIIGGTGFIGTNVQKALADHQVAVFHRGRSKSMIQGVTVLQGDRARLQDHQAKIASWRPDVVLDMIPRNGQDAREVANVIVNHTSRLVVVSSASVYRNFGRLIGTEQGPIDNTPSTEAGALRSTLFPYRGAVPRPAGDPLQWLDDYDKIPVEDSVLAFPGLHANVVRLPMVYGPRDPDNRVGKYLQYMSNKYNRIRLPEPAASWRNSRAFVQNVGVAIASVIARGAPGLVYNVSERHLMSELEWVRTIGEVAGWTGQVERVEKEPRNDKRAHHITNPVPSMYRNAKTQAGRNEKHAGRDHQVSPANNRCVDIESVLDEMPPNADYAYHIVMDDSRIRHELKYSEVISLEDGLRQTIEALRGARCM